MCVYVYIFTRDHKHNSTRAMSRSSRASSAGSRRNIKAIALHVPAQLQAVSPRFSHRACEIPTVNRVGLHGAMSCCAFMYSFVVSPAVVLLYCALIV